MLSYRRRFSASYRILPKEDLHGTNFYQGMAPRFVIGAVTVMIYMLFRILSTRVIRFILNKLPDDADQNIATALYKPGRLAIISGGIYLMVQAAPLDVPRIQTFVQHVMASCVIIAFHWVWYNFFSSTNYVFSFLTKKANGVLTQPWETLFPCACVSLSSVSA